MAERRKKIIMEQLEQSQQPISASTFAQELGVTRQIIVGDIALLRAGGASIIATPRGYLLESKPSPSFLIACKHNKEGMRDELYTIVDCGCGLIDVIVEHPLYGQITCNLHIFSRSEADAFLEKLEETQAQPLCQITNDIHLHTLQCPSEVHFQEVLAKLKAKDLLIERT